MELEPDEILHSDEDLVTFLNNLTNSQRMRADPRIHKQFNVQNRSSGRIVRFYIASLATIYNGRPSILFDIKDFDDSRAPFTRCNSIDEAIAFINDKVNNPSGGKRKTKKTRRIKRKGKCKSRRNKRRRKN
jgi:hypothetical protein